MKKIKQIFLLSTLMLTTLFVGCNEDEFAGQSNLEVAQGVKITVTTDFASPVSIIEGDNKYKFTVTIDKPQSVDLVVKINQVGGTASADDYAVNSSITIPAYKLSATAELKILKDDLHEATEDLILQIGDNTTANAAVAPVTVTFNILNYTEGSLVSSLSWKTSTDLKDIEGVSITPNDAADLKLLITKLDNTVLKTVDASKDKFESFEMLSTYADGTYLVVAKATSFKNLGAQGYFDLDLTVKFNQTGVYNDKTFTFEKALNSAGLTSCGATGYFKLAQITKSGSTYTLSEVGEAAFSFDASLFNGNYKVTKDAWNDYTVGAIVPVVYNAADGTTTFRINNTNNGALVNAATSYMIVKINQATGDVISVTSNEAFDYGGTDQTSIAGTGTVNFCDKSINLLLKFPDFTANTYAFNLVKI